MNVITVSGETLDLYENDIINLNIQINDISDLSTRNSTYSNSFLIPKTSNNQSIFELVGVYGNTSRLPYKKVKCKYIKDGISLITNGYLQITDVTTTNYRVVMYDGIIDLSEALKDKCICDLNFNVYNFITSESKYTDSFSATTGYVYAIADFGVNVPTDSSPYQIEYQLPSMYVHNLFDEIITQAGFTYEGDIFSDSDYLSLLVAPSNGFDIVDAPFTESPLSDYESDNLNLTTSGAFNHQFTLSGAAITGLSLINDYTIQVDFDGRLIIDITTEYNIVSGFSYIYLKKNGASLKTLLYDDITHTSGSDLNSLTVPVTTGDLITLDGLAVQRGGVLDFTTSSVLDFTQVNGGTFIDFATLYGSDKQSDLIKDITQHYGMLMIRDNEVANHLKFTTFESLLQDKANAEDWTDKLININNESYGVDGYGKNSSMVYKYESDVDVYDYDGTMIIDNEFIEENKTLFTSVFKIRNNRYSDMSKPIYHIPLWEEKMVDGTLSNIAKKTDSTLFKCEMVNDTIGFKLYNDGTPTNFTGNIPIIGFTDINYQNYVDNYYDQLNQLLNNNKKISVTVNLNPIDIKNLDFFKLKYFKESGKYYYLNSVKSSGGKNATAELVEINN